MDERNRSRSHQAVLRRVIVCIAMGAGIPRIAVWNLWLCGYAMLTITAAALTAEADWEPHSNIAPWTLGFSQDAIAVSFMCLVAA
jgi:hypothetical protein